MKIPEKRKLQVLGVLIILLAFSLYRNLSDSQTETSGEVRGVSFQADTSASAEEIVNIRRLDRKMPRVRRIERNLFQFQDRSTPMIVERQLPETFPETPPAEEVPSIRYLGMYVEKKENGLRLAVASNSGRIFVGKEGDILGGKYRLLRIESEYLLMELTSDGRKFRVPIGQSSIRFLD